MQIGSGAFTFEWMGDFAEIPRLEEARHGWAHHGMAYSANGNLLTFHPSRSALLELTTGGRLVRATEVPLEEGHGITICQNGAGESIWVADNGRKRQPHHHYHYVSGKTAGRAVKMSRSGTVEMELLAPDLPIYESGTFSPTQVAVWQERDGGNGDVWLADGYGAHKVHRFTASGAYVSCIDGGEGRAGAFKTPHALYFDSRRQEAELYVADRANNRIQVYSPDGKFKRCFGEDFLITPTAFAPYGDYLVVAELSARLAILDGDDRLVTYLGDNRTVANEPGWPNRFDEGGRLVRTNRLKEGLFNSPHGLATDEDGNIFVSEWLIGGRFIKLAKV